MDATPPRIWKTPDGTCDFTAIVDIARLPLRLLSPRATLFPALSWRPPELRWDRYIRSCGHVAYTYFTLTHARSDDHTYTSPVSSSPASLATASFNPRRSSLFPRPLPSAALFPSRPSPPDTHARACSPMCVHTRTHGQTAVGVPSLFIEVVAPPHLRRCSVSFEVRDVASVISTPQWETIKNS